MLLTTSVKSSNKGSYPDPHWNFKQGNRLSFKARVFIISLYTGVHIDLKWRYLILIWFDLIWKMWKISPENILVLQEKGCKVKLWFLLVFMQKGCKIAKNILGKGVLFNSQNDDGVPIFYGSAGTGRTVWCMLFEVKYAYHIPYI